MTGALRKILENVAADRGGNVMIEFALALPILFLLMAGLMDLGTFAYQKSAMLQGAREGAQYGMLNSSDSTNINTTAQNATGLTGVTATNTVFCECTAGTTTTCGGTCTGGGAKKKYITVNVTRTFTSIIKTTTMNFGQLGSWTPPTSVNATVTMLVTGN